MKVSRFKQYLSEMSAYAAEMPQEVDGVSYGYSNHFFDRLSERGTITLDQLKAMVKKVRTQLAELPMKGDFLFFSKSLKQGIVAAWDAIKSKLNFITFLPPKKNPDEYFAKSGTSKVVFENINKNITIIYID
jgi:hypothetical protein